MGVIYRTTLVPTKLELLTDWLPGQPWYAGTQPSLVKGGGFRLDDPAGEVGIEFLVAVDVAGGQPIAYLVPVTYRASPVDELAGALIGTAEHGVLGTRWVYDGAHDPVLATELLALIQGRVAAQAQSESHTADATVVSEFAYPAALFVSGAATIGNHPDGTDLACHTVTDDGTAGPKVMLHIVRVLSPDMESGDVGQITANWSPADGRTERGPVVTARAQS